MGWGSWAGVAVQALGVVLIVVVLADVFFTVLFPASGHGPLRRPLSRRTWRTFSLVGRRVPTPRRRRFLAYSGPVLIAATILTWVVLLVVGWALVFWPELGAGVHASKGGTDHGFATAVYFSGFTLTTLGVGDLVPASGVDRVLTVVEAAIGFSIFTMVLTYFLSIYSALTARKSFAVSLDHRTFGTGIPVQLLVGLADDGDLRQARQQISTLAEFLTQTTETHRAYPVLRYFHFRDDRYALPRLLLIALESVTLVRSALAASSYDSLIRSSAVYELSASGLEALEELVPRVSPAAASREQRADWDKRFRLCVEELREAGLDVTSDLDRSAEEYAALRQRWDAPLRALSGAMLYHWDEIDVAPT